MTGEHPIERRETGRPWARDVPVGPDMTPEAVPFTDEALRGIYARIERINAHFDACCAFQQDSCHWGDEYDRLYDLLHLAGMDPVKTPCERDVFEAWLASRTT